MAMQNNILQMFDITPITSRDNHAHKRPSRIHEAVLLKEIWKSWKYG